MICAGWLLDQAMGQRISRGDPMRRASNQASRGKDFPAIPVTARIGGRNAVPDATC
jgi:hypothetical protein